MNFFPLFHQLNNKYCLIVGGGQVALRRAQALYAAGVCIDVISPVVGEQLVDVVKESGGNIDISYFDEALFNKKIQDKNYFMVMAATDDKAVNVTVYRCAKSNNMLVNIASDQSLCDVVFPAIIDRGPTTIAISNNGLSPVLTRVLKEKVEHVIPDNYGALADLMGKYRETIKDRIPNTKKRVAFLERIAKGSVAEAIFLGKPDRAEKILQAKLSQQTSESMEKEWAAQSSIDQPATDFSYTTQEKSAIYKVMAERRDMRHFNSQPLDEKIFKHILSAAHMAPSVGLMQPWRFIRITQQKIREDIFGIVNEERKLTADALDTRKGEFLKLKVEGILQCGELVIAALPEGREQHIFGRRTLPEMDLASLSCAIQNMWLAARAEGIGMGWVSLFDPKKLMQILNMPEGSWPIAILCIGHVDEFYEKPMLVLENWTTEQPLEDMLFENTWNDTKGQGGKEQSDNDT